MLVTIHNNANQIFWILYFLFVFRFLTQKQIKIDQKHVKTFKVKSKRIHKSFQHLLKGQHKSHKQSMSQNIGSINAWTCCNAYALVPFFTLKDWLPLFWLSNPLLKLVKQVVNALIIFITSQCQTQLLPLSIAWGSLYPFFVHLAFDSCHSLMPKAYDNLVWCVLEFHNDGRNIEFLDLFLTLGLISLEPQV